MVSSENFSYILENQQMIIVIHTISDSLETPWQIFVTTRSVYTMRHVYITEAVNGLGRPVTSYCLHEHLKEAG